MSNIAVLNPNYSPQLTLDQLGEMIVKESRRGAEKYAFRYLLDAHDMEDWLVSEIYMEIMSNPKMQNIKGIRYIIRLRSVDYMREVLRDNVCKTFSAYATTSHNHYRDDDYNYPIEEVFESFQVPSVEEKVLEHSDLRDFLDTLELQDRQIVELSAGITDSLDDYQIIKVKDLIDKKSVCKCSSANCRHSVNVWLTTSEVGEILGLSRRQVQYPLSKMSEKALDFGLWF